MASPAGAQTTNIYSLYHVPDLPAENIDVKKTFGKMLKKDGVVIGEEGPGTKFWRKGVVGYKKGIDKIGQTVYNWICKRRVPDAVKNRAQHLVDVYDGAAEPVDTYTETLEEAPKNKHPGSELKRANKKPRRTNGDWWVEYALRLRMEHPYPSDTVEQRRSMHRHAVDMMKAEKVRNVDIARVIALVVELAYVPTEGEVLAAEVRETPVVRHRLWDAGATYWSWWYGVKPRQTATG